MNFRSFLLILICLVTDGHAADGDIDPSFLVNELTNGSDSPRVLALAIQNDGKVLMGGGFTSVGGIPRHDLARLNVDGSVDQSFNPSVSGSVEHLAIQDDGKVIIAGSVTMVDGVVRNLARLNADGSLDPNFNPNLVDAVTDDGQTFRSVTTVRKLRNGKILISSIVNGLYQEPDRSFVRLNTAKLIRINKNGSIDTGFNLGVSDNSQYPSISGIVEQSDGKIIIAGSFSSYNGVQRNGMARLNSDGSVDMTYNPRVVGSARYLELQSNGRAIIGGRFSSVGGVTQHNLARVNPDGSLDTSFNAGLEESDVAGMLVQSDDRIVLQTYRCFTTYPYPCFRGTARIGPNGAGLGVFPYASDVMISQSDGKIFSGTDRVRRLQNSIYFPSIPLDTDELCILIKSKDKSSTVVCL